MRKTRIRRQLSPEIFSKKILLKFHIQVSKFYPCYSSIGRFSMIDTQNI